MDFISERVTGGPVLFAISASLNQYVRENDGKALHFQTGPE